MPPEINNRKTTPVISKAIGVRLLSHRRLLIGVSQILLIVFTYYVSFLLRFDFALDASAKKLFIATVIIVLAIKLPVLHHFSLLRGWWRYVGMNDLWDIVKASLASSSLLYLLLHFARWPAGYPRSVIVIDMVLTILLVGGARFAVRSYTESVHAYAALKQTLIVGAGSAGTELLRDLKRNPQLDYDPVGLVDDDTRKLGLKIHGRKVLGTTSELSRLITENQVECVLIAIPSASGMQIQQILDQCRQCKVEFKILAGLGERINGSAYATELRQVRVEDLLGRQPVRLNLDGIRQRVSRRPVLITGAGGSIGSELARQVARFGPSKLLLFERSESDLFRLCNELSAAFPQQECVPIVGDILDVRALRECFALHRPQSVFHAAAYKHVPMMEMNCFQAVANNIFGTYNAALVARQYQVDDFVMISSDKAVNPTSIMGVTKRVAELIILALQEHGTRFVAVRFGNVLGSNGSVLPIFQEQLRKGGPLTVTHPDVKRYFMTIPEAVQLVLEASSMGKGGEIFVLDMGAPVKVLDLAKNLIRISGCENGNEPKIIFTGLRPGEKLLEELQFGDEGLKATSHEKIRVLDGGRVEFPVIRSWLEELSALVEARNVQALVAKLKEQVPEYTPSPEILALCDIDRHDLSLRYRRAPFELTPTGTAA